MKSKAEVQAIVNELTALGKGRDEIIWQAARACEGWPYVFAATGQECTPANRRAKYREDHPTIKTSCRNYDGSGSCSGCKWLPGGERVRIGDCQGFVKYTAGYVGVSFSGGGCTSMWADEDQWSEKGTIDSIPEDRLVCVFIHDAKTGKKSHVGWSWHGETVECSAGVQYSAKLNKKWTHWARPKALDGAAPAPVPGDNRPTLRRGSRGEYVQLAQTKLLQLGYPLPKYGADGSYGTETITAVMQFQRDNGLNADGICGPKTWAALDRSEPMKLYTVTIQHLPLYKAEAFVSAYDGATMTEEDGAV